MAQFAQTPGESLQAVSHAEWSDGCEHDESCPRRHICREATYIAAGIDFEAIC